MKPRDFQRQRVYDWERIFWEQQSLMTLVQIERLATVMCEDVNVRVTPRIRDGRGSRRPCAFSNGVLRFPRFSRKPWLVAHEVAHLASTYHISSHGAEFVGIMCYLASRFPSAESTVASPTWQHQYDRLTESARSAKVKVLYHWWK